MATDATLAEPAADTRTRILDATEELMLEEGYAGVSSRKVSARAGLKSKILHYYFKTMDDLFIAAFERREEQYFARFAAAAAAPDPLRELWSLAVQSANNKLYLEYNALASHRPRLRAFIARSNARDRVQMTEALSVVFSARNIDTERLPPAAVATAIAGLARVFATDLALGTSEGHASTIALVDRLLRDIVAGEPRLADWPPMSEDKAPHA